MEFLDADVVRRAAAHDQAAMTELYTKTNRELFKLIRSIVRNEDDANDILQDSFIKCFAKLRDLEHPERFMPWMKRIAANTAKDYLKKKKPMLFTELSSDEDEGEIDFEEYHLEALPDVAMDRRETQRLMQEMLPVLSEDQRLVVGLYFYQQMSIKEIAAFLQCSENTVKSRLNYAKKKLKAKVLDLEKKGTKLYSLSPMGFLVWLLRMDADCAAPSAAVLEHVLQRSALSSASSSFSIGFDPQSKPQQFSSPSAPISDGKQGLASGGDALGQTTSSTAASAGAKAAVGVETAVKAAAGAGTKAIATKVIVGVLAAALVGGGAAIGLHSRRSVPDPISSQPQDMVSSEITAEPDHTASEEATVSGSTSDISSELELAYASVRQSFLDADGLLIEDPNTFFNSNPYAGMACFASPYLRDGSLFTADYDINQDGTPELVIGRGTDTGGIYIVEIYGYDGQLKQLINDPALGEHSMLEIKADGFLSLVSAGGMEGTYYSLMHLAQDSCDIAEQQSFIMIPTDPDLESKLAQWQEALDSHGPNADLPWVELASDSTLE